MIELLENLAKTQPIYIEHKGLHMRPKKQLKPLEQKTKIQYILNLPSYSVYIEHMNWINFEHYKYPKPIYINLVRDPVERVISWYYYVRNGYKNAIFFKKFPNAPIPSEEWFKKDYNKCVLSGDPECQYIPGEIRDTEHNFKRQTLFFCGHTEECL